VDRSITVVPDWVCEILSPSTRSLDQRIKRPFYARIGVVWLWTVDLEARTLSVCQLHEGRWLELAVHGEDDVVRAAPFEEMPLALAEWWRPGAV
jgi:Uma2 family endonuclease